MREIRIIRRGRLRRVPPRFGWVDRRLATEGRLAGLSSSAQGLYLFLVAVGNRDGISWYSDESVRERTGLSQSTLESGRRDLVDGDLLAFEAPFYQLLSLPDPDVAPKGAPVMAPKGERPASAGQIEAILEEGRRRLFGRGSC